MTNFFRSRFFLKTYKKTFQG